MNDGNIGDKIKLVHRPTNTYRYGQIARIEGDVIYYNCYVRGIFTTLSSDVGGNINYEVLPNDINLKLCKNS